MEKLDKQRLIFGLFLIAFIIILELILHHFHLPAWPAFLVMIFFFETHMDPKKASHIIVGGLFGILCLILTGLFIKALAPVLGLMTARLAFICLVVYAIVVFGEMLPMVFNNYAFMFFLISGLAATVPNPAPNPYLWMGIELVGGTIIILGVMGIGKLMALLFTPATGGTPPVAGH
ncbi:MAG: hypothetical protein KKA41_11835 [Proteobacteria bacterium]|nr:hypothetical protein [Pseudomonadota bacterium]